MFNKHQPSVKNLLVSTTVTFVTFMTIGLFVALFLNFAGTLFGAFSNTAHAATYSASLSTSGSVSLDVSATGNGANITTDNVNVISTCPLGYTVSIAATSSTNSSFSDTTLYKDGDANNTAATKKINPSTGTTLAPVPILGSSGGTDYTKTWGYTTEAVNSGNPVTINSNFIGLTNTQTILTTSNTATSATGTNLPVYYGASVDNTIEPGEYKMSDGGVITYYLTTPLDCTSYQVAFNPTSTAGGQTISGTGTMQPQRIAEGVATALDANTFTAPTGYYFKEWNTAQDGTGTVYTDGQSVTDLVSAGTTITLYAQWSAPAYLDSGANVNVKMKNLANNTTSATINTTDTAIQVITRANSLPSGFTPSADNTISVSTSRLPVYIFFDNNTGTMYYYSISTDIRFQSNASSMFRGLSTLVNIDTISSWNTSGARILYYMFSGASSLTNLDALSGWDVSAATNMNSMFLNASSLVNIDGVSNWNTSAVTDMGRMFNGASSLTNLDALSNWNTSAVTNMGRMFDGASSLTNINGASNWKTAAVTNMASMFSSASSLTNIDGASNWDTSAVINMNSMFSSASSLTNIDGASNWNTSAVTDITSMFYGVNNIDATVLNGWNVANITSKLNAFTCPVAQRPSWY